MDDMKLVLPQSGLFRLCKVLSPPFSLSYFFALSHLISISKSFVFRHSEEELTKSVSYICQRESNRSTTSSPIFGRYYQRANPADSCSVTP